MENLHDQAIYSGVAGALGICEKVNAYEYWGAADFDKLVDAAKRTEFARIQHMLGGGGWSLARCERVFDALRANS